MLAEFRPGLLSGEFTVTRLRDPRQEEPGAEQREAA